MLRLWDALVGCAALLGIVITGFGVMLQLVEASEAMRRLGTIVGCALLLTILPPIIVGIWLRLPVWEQIGVCTICGMVVAIMLRVGKGKTRYRGWS